MRLVAVLWGLALASLAVPMCAAQVAPKGEVKGTGWTHTSSSAIALTERASIAFPSKLTGGETFLGQWKDAPLALGGSAPVVLFLHGSSGLGLKAIGEWQTWLAGKGIASVAPDSFAIPDRVTYASPVGMDVYERIHELRSSEIALTLAAVKRAPWADKSRIALAGTSEGAVAVARYGGPDVVARVVFAWSCENNYFVAAHRTQVVSDQPFLNVISSVDPFFSRQNSYLGNPEAKGHCGSALADSKRATVVLVPGAPHTLINLPQVRLVTHAFLEDAFAGR